MRLPHILNTNCKYWVPKISALLTWLRIGGSHDPFLGFANLLEDLTEIRKAIYLLFLVYYKGYKSNRRDSWGKILVGRVGVTELPHILLAHHPPYTLIWSPTETFPKPHCVGFLWRFHYKHDWFNHQCDWTQSILPLPSLPYLDIRRWSWKFQPSNHMVTSPTWRISRGPLGVTSATKLRFG